MTSITIKATKADFSSARLDRDRYTKEMRKVGYDATDLAIQRGAARVKARMRSVGLGGLSNAVGWTSAKKKGQTDRKPYGALFAKGGDDSRAGGALESYTHSANITPLGRWLAVPTKAVPRLVSVGGRRQRLTPALWEKAGLDRKIGELRFVQVSSSQALLLVNNVSLSPKNGQAKAMGPRGTRTRIVPKRAVVAFVLIRNTRRAKRFDQEDEIFVEAARVADYIARLLQGYQRRG